MAGGDVPQDPAGGNARTPSAPAAPGPAPAGPDDARRAGDPEAATTWTASAASPDATPPADAPPVARPRRRVLHLALVLLAVPPLLVALAALAVWGAWRSLHTEDGTRWWLHQAEAVSYTHLTLPTN